MLELVAYYCVTWLLGGAALLLLCRPSAPPAPSAIPFLGGASAVGAIVAVLGRVLRAVGHRRARGVGVRPLNARGRAAGALAPAVALNRLAITLVEALLLAAAAGLARTRKPS